VITPLEKTLEKFRAQYPQGRLITDVALVHEGQYVVRAAVMQKGETLATGLSASADVELAEDQARGRAIAALGITMDAPIIQKAHLEPTHDSTSNNIVDPTDSEFISIDLPEEDLSPPIDHIEDRSVKETSNGANAPLANPAAAIALENYSASPYPVDLSDIIAQTDVELTRLGWSAAQGREYLEKTYGKRSRQQLTDEELMSFLLYLEEH
jgi:hypothetical protein